MKRFLSVILMLAIFICASTALADNSVDPVISYSYIRDSYIVSMLTKGEAAVEKSFKEPQSILYGLETELVVGKGLYDGYEFASTYTILELAQGGSVTVPTGGSFILLSGSALLDIQSGEVLNLSSGAEVEDRTQLEINERYFAPESSVVSAVVYSGSASVLVDGYYKYKSSGTLTNKKVFFDINGHWAKDSIMYLAERDIMNGMVAFEFQPETNMTREMFVTVLGRLFGVNTNSYPNAVFKDVVAGSWYAPYVEWAAETDIVKGYDTGIFGTGESITRQQMAVLIMRYAEYANIELAEKIVNPTPFEDSGKIADWAADGVLMAQKTGLISGRTGNIFDPTGTATRAEVATIIYRLLTVQ